MLSCWSSLQCIVRSQDSTLKEMMCYCKETRLIIVVIDIAALEKSRHEDGSGRIGVALSSPLGLHDQDQVWEQQRHAVQVNHLSPFMYLNYNFDFFNSFTLKQFFSTGVLPWVASRCAAKFLYRLLPINEGKGLKSKELLLWGNANLFEIIVWTLFKVYNFMYFGCGFKMKPNIVQSLN